MTFVHRIARLSSYGLITLSLVISQYSIAIAQQIEVSDTQPVIYELPSVVVPAQSYVVLSDQQTGLVLPNTGSSLQLIAPNGDIVDQSEPYDQLPDDVVWALIDSEWVTSYEQTPGTVNSLVSVKPCPSGLTRATPEATCKKFVSTVISSLDCPAGQVRNPETKRCRKIETVVSVKPCTAGYIKNPLTGRCKKQEQIVNKTCPTGQERNEQTGRCRKIVGGGTSLASVKDTETPFIQNNAKWWAAGMAGTGSVSYAAYEWREELRRRLDGLLSKLKR